MALWNLSTSLRRLSFIFSGASCLLGMLFDRLVKRQIRQPNKEWIELILLLVVDSLFCIDFSFFFFFFLCVCGVWCNAFVLSFLAILLCIILSLNWSIRFLYKKNLYKKTLDELSMNIYQTQHYWIVAILLTLPSTQFKTFKISHFGFELIP